METDYSKQIYHTYFSLKNRTVKVVLKNGRNIQGIICGFFKGDPERQDPYIVKWHIVAEAEKNRFGTNILGYITGELIKQEDILEVQFGADKKDE